MTVRRKLRGGPAHERPHDWQYNRAIKRWFRSKREYWPLLPPAARRTLEIYAVKGASWGTTAQELGHNIRTIRRALARCQVELAKLERRELTLKGRADFIEVLGLHCHSYCAFKRHGSNTVSDARRLLCTLLHPNNRAIREQFLLDHPWARCLFYKKVLNAFFARQQ